MPPQNAADGSGNPSSGGESGNSSGEGTVKPADIQRMISEEISKALGSRLKRQQSSMEEMIAKTVAESLKSYAPAATSEAASSAPAEVPTGDKLTVKALDAKYEAQMKAMRDEVTSMRKAKEDAEARATQTRLHADLESNFAKHMGADNPHLKPYINQYANQFEHRDGVTFRKVKDEYDNETYQPIDRAAEELFKSDLKHLIPQKSKGLPPSSLARGVPMPDAPASSRGNGILDELRRGLSGLGTQDPNK